MSETKTPRTPAGERGTDHRIDTGHGHYWVRLLTRGAIQREGECMSNCCRHGSYHHRAGAEELSEAALWSLRRIDDGVSIALAEVDNQGDLDEFKGPMNNQPSGAAYRQLRQLREYLVAGGAKLGFPYRGVIVDDEGNTFRPDKAPQHVRDAIEAKEAAERKAREEAHEQWLRERVERHAQYTAEQEMARLQPGQIRFRPQRDDNFRPLSANMYMVPDEIELDFAPVRYVPRQGVRRTVELQTRFETRGLDALVLAMRQFQESALANLVRGEAYRPGAFARRPEQAPRPALPDLSSLPTPQARMRAIRENQQARLADRRWVRDNERSQRSLVR